MWIEITDFGEDQILTQIKNALALSRENETTDSVLEVLFRRAVTAAKRVKTEVAFSRANGTAMDQAIYMLRHQGFLFDQAVCMVVGNGEMGKLAAQSLQQTGADVTVTIRQYRSGVVEIPQGLLTDQLWRASGFSSGVRSCGQCNGKSELHIYRSTGKGSEITAQEKASYLY